MKKKERELKLKNELESFKDSIHQTMLERMNNINKNSIISNEELSGLARIFNLDTWAFDIKFGLQIVI